MTTQNLPNSIAEFENQIANANYISTSDLQNTQDRIRVLTEALEICGNGIDKILAARRAPKP